jgi:hypothetical protein
MHWVYGFYLFACTAHVPVFLTLLAVGKCVQQMRLERNQTKYLLQMNDTVCLRAVQVSLNAEGGGAGLMAVIFAMLFMALNDDDEPSSAALLALRACFWGFAWFHGGVIHSGWPVPVVSADAATGLRLLSLWCLCRSAAADKGWPSFAGAVCAYALWLVVFLSYHAGFPWGLFVLQLFLDAVLALGHRYDNITPLKTVMYCRLCYVALSGCVLHAAAVSG